MEPNRNDLRLPRNHCVPDYYRKSQAIESKGKVFDIHIHSDVLEDDVEPPNNVNHRGVPHYHQLINPTPTELLARVIANNSCSTLTDPLVVQHTDCKQAQDIEYFYDRDENGAFCKFCL